MMRRALLPVLALLLARPAQAGIVYDFLTTVEAERTAMRVTGRVWVEGNSYRAELSPDPARNVDVIISNDGDRTAIFLDVDKQTWVERVRPGNDVRSSSVFRWPTAGGVAVRGRPRVEHRIDGSAEIAGHRAKLHVVTARFDAQSLMDDVPVRGTIETTARIWIADELPSLPMDRQLRTGYPEVDRRLGAIFADLEGMILRHELEVVRTMEGGPPQKEVTKTIVTRVEIGDVPRERFEVPATFAYAGKQLATRR